MSQIKAKRRNFCLRKKLQGCFLLIILISLIGIGILQFVPHSLQCNGSKWNLWICKSISDIYNPAPDHIFLEGCNCTKKIQPPLRPLVAPRNSSCNKDTWKYGEGQRVISYSFFGSDPEGYYTAALEIILKSARKLYPGWLIRIYTDNNMSKFKAWCPVLCNSPPEVLWCDVRTIEDVGDISTTDPRTWRFLPIGDPLVEIFISRDLDSPLLPRERTAVDEWLSSNKTFHTMRDHKGHTVSFLGGMWGTKRDQLDPKKAQDLQNYFIKQGQRSNLKGYDQILLNAALYNTQFHNRTLAHDDFFCGRFPNTECRPIPTQYERTDFNFIGSVLLSNITQEDYIVPKYLEID